MHDPNSPSPEPKTFVELLKSPDVFERRYAAAKLGMFYELTDCMQAALGEALFDPDDEVCQNAVMSLFFKSRSKAILPFLIRALQHRDMGVRRVVMTTLGMMGDAANEAIPFLAEIVNSDIAEMRAWARSTIARITGTATIEPMKRNIFPLKKKRRLAAENTDDQSLEP